MASSIIDTQDEKVLIAVSALGDMRGSGLAVERNHVPAGPSTSSTYWDRGSHSRDLTSIAPTPSLSAASTSSQATSPSTVTRSLDDDEYDDRREFVSKAADSADSVLTRVSNIPLVNTALRAYDYSKASSRVINYGAGLVESSVKAVSKPVINRLPVEQLDEFACRQLDRLGKYGGGPRNDSNDAESSSSAQSRDRSTSRVRSRASTKDEPHTPQSSRMDTESEAGDTSQGQIEVANRSGWQTVLLEAGGIGAAISEENMKRLKYCLEWLQFATTSIDRQISLLQKFLISLDEKLSENPGALVPFTQMKTLNDAKREVIQTVKQVVEVMSKYAGGSLPAPARATVRNFILLLPERWANAMRQQEEEMGPVPAAGGGNELAASAAERACKRVLTLANESLDMMKGATGVFRESLDRAEAWVERLRIIGIQRQQQQAGQLASTPSSPAVNIQSLSISSLAYDDTPVGRRRPSHPHSDPEEDEENATETEAGSSHGSSGRSALRRRQRRRIASPSPGATARLSGAAPSADVAM